MKRIALALALLFALAAPAAAQQVRPEIEQRVLRALFVIEGEAPDSFFVTLGNEGRDALLAMVRDRSRGPGVRRRAVLALRHYPEASVRAELEQRAVDVAEDAIVSRYALRALASAFAASTFEILRARLDDPRALVREGAAVELGGLDLERARPLLAARAAQESEAFVRDRIERLLAPR